MAAYALNQALDVLVLARPTDRSLVEIACARAAISCLGVSDPISAAAALVEHTPTLLVLTEDPGGVDFPRFLLLIEQQFPKLIRLQLVSEKSKGFKLDFGSRGSKTSTELQLPSTKADIDTFGEKLRALLP